MRETTTTLSELEVGDNVFRNGHAYMVTRHTIHEDDTTVTIKLGYPRKVDDGFEPLTEFTGHARQPFIKYV